MRWFPRRWICLPAFLLVLACQDPGQVPGPDAEGPEAKSADAAHLAGATPAEGGGGGAEPAAPELAAPPQDVTGEWKVSYHDRALGAVEGRAFVNAEASSVRVELRHPRSGELFTLRSKSFSYRGRRLEVVLEGTSPRSPRRDGLDYPERHLVLPKSPGTVKLRHGQDELEADVAELPPTDAEEITLELQADEGDWVGTWRYRGHRFLERAEDGYGRAGEVQVAEDGTAHIVGGETWSRPVPLILGIVPIEDQLSHFEFQDATSSPNYPYPFGRRSADKTTRTLFVFGRDLPMDPSRRLEITSADPGLSYALLARPGDAERSPFHRQNFQRGWEKLYAGLPPEHHAEASEMDALIVRAHFDASTLPGFQELSFAGTRGTWLLQFGDNTAEISFVRLDRPPRHEEDEPTFERITEAFSPEVVWIEVRTHLALPVDELRVLVGLNGQQLAVSDAGEEAGLPARRVPGEPRLFRTAAFHLSDRGGSHPRQVAARPGDRLFASLGEPGLISLQPALARLGIHRSPAAPGIETFWADAVLEAARCQDLEAPSLAEIEGSGAGTIDTFLFNTGRHTLATPGWLEAEVQVGHHAAMLVLRNTFVQLMEDYDRELAGLVSDDAVRAFRRHIEPALRAEETGLSRIRVDGPDGFSMSLASTFDVYGIAEGYHLDIPAADRWVLDATRQAIGRYREAIDHSLDEAREIDHCDVEDLLKLTGSGFEPVAAVARSRLMSLVELGSPPAQMWRPNRRARAWVDNIALLAETVALHERIQQEDRTEVTLALSFASLAVGAVGGLAALEVAMVASALVDVLDAAIAFQDVISDVAERSREVQFALGASDVLGVRRLQLAEENDRGWGFVVGSVIASGAPLLVLQLDDLAKLSRLRVFALPEIPRWAKPWRAGLLARAAQRGRRIAEDLVHRSPREAAAAVASAAEEAAVTRYLGQLEGAAAGVRPGDAVPGAGPPGSLDEALGGGRPADGPAPPTDAPQPPRADTRRLEAFLETASDRDRISFFAWLEQAHLARQAGGVLSGLQTSVLEAVESLPRVRWRLGLERPPGLGEANWQTVKRFLRRQDVLDLLDAGGGPALESALSAGGRRGRIAREVLEYTPQRTPEQFLREVAKRMKRRPSPGAAYFEQASALVKENWEKLKKAGWFFKLSGPYADSVMIMKVTDPQGNSASVTRSYDAAKAEFSLDMAYREQVRSMIEGVLPVSLTEKGVPTFQFMTLRIMQEMGIGFAGSGKPLRTVKVSQVMNYRNCIELEWLLRHYKPGVALKDVLADPDLSRLLRQTHSVRYAESLMEMAGYRVTRASMNFDHSLIPPQRGRIGSLAGTYSPTRYAGVPESRAAFLERYGLPANVEAGGGFNLVLEVEPIPGAVQASLAPGVAIPGYAAPGIPAPGISKPGILAPGHVLTGRSASRYARLRETTSVPGHCRTCLEQPRRLAQARHPRPVNHPRVGSGRAPSTGRWPAAIATGSPFGS